MTTISIEAANEGLDAACANCNGGRCRFYTGSKPATPDTAASGTLLADLAMNATAFASASSKRATANAITSVAAAAAGTAGYCRLTKSDNSGVFDLVAGGSWIVTANSGTDQLTTNVAHGLSADTPVELFLEAGGAAPGGLAIETTYFAKTPSGSTLQLAATAGGAAIDITSAGTATIRLKLAATEAALASSDGSIAAGVTVSVAALSVRFP